MDAFALLETWIRRHAADLRESGLTPSHLRDDGTAAFDLEAPTRSARLTVTAGGEAVIDRAEWSSDLLMIPERRVLTTEEELEAALTAVVQWAQAAEPAARDSG